MVSYFVKSVKKSIKNESRLRKPDETLSLTALVVVYE